MTQDNDQFEHLFEIELHYKEGKEPVTTPRVTVGEYIGSGEGRIEGPKLKGSVHWDLFEDQAGTVCPSNMRGLIETDDGAKIDFDTMGFFRRPDTDSSIWRATATVHFETEDERYLWLNSILASWEGEFDMSKYVHRYSAHVTSAA